MTPIDIDQILFDDSQKWLELAPHGPRVLLTPLDWTDYETCRRLAMIPGTDQVDLKQMYRQLVKRTQSVDWEGFERNGQPLPFDRDVLVKIVCSSVEIGVRFDAQLKAWATQTLRQEQAEAKNSGAGRATKSTQPGRPKKTETTAPDSASNA